MSRLLRVMGSYLYLDELRLWHSGLVRLCHVYWRTSSSIRKLDHGRRLLLCRFTGSGRDCCCPAYCGRHLLLELPAWWRGMGPFPELDDGLVELVGHFRSVSYTLLTSSQGRLGNSRAGRATRLHKLPPLGSDDQIPWCDHPIQGLVLMAPHEHWHDFRHAPKHTLAQTSPVLLPLRHFHLLLPLLHVLDLVPHPRLLLLPPLRQLTRCLLPLLQRHQPWHLHSSLRRLLLDHLSPLWRLGLLRVRRVGPLSRRDSPSIYHSRTWHVDRHL